MSKQSKMLECVSLALQLEVGLCFLTFFQEELKNGLNEEENFAVNSLYYGK